MERVQPWRKILYEKQAYPDNYVDVSFLELLLLNAKPVSYSYWGTAVSYGTTSAVPGIIQDRHPEL